MVKNFEADWEEQASAPPTPATGLWRIYFKSDGLYVLEDDGTEHGPFSAATSSATGEIYVPASAMWPSTTTGAADAAKTEYGTNDVDLFLMAFDQSTEEYGQFNVRMPQNWDAGTITFQPLWTAASGSGDVIWGLQGRSYADDDALDAAWGTAQEVTDTLLAADDLHVGPESAAITLAGSPAAGQLMQLRIYRKAADGGDTLNADALLAGFTVFYTKS